MTDTTGFRQQKNPLDDILLNKMAVIERALARIDEEYRGHEEEELATNFSRQDAIVLNLQRACEAAIDAAMHVVRTRCLGVPQQSREAFALLQDAGVIDVDVAQRMQAMVGFRNIAVHDYQALRIDILRTILERRLGDFHAFRRSLMHSAAA